jgi:tRNA threonylcarbamoyladenosine biosynthesis protein TsaE
MKQFQFRASSLADTDRLGEALATLLPDGTVVGLVGTLGSGKTRLVQALAAACGVPRETVVSPTFVLCQEYSGRRQLFHLDAYRLRDEDEFAQLGPEELFDSPAITLIEWADRIKEALPDDRLTIDIVVEGETSRVFRFEAFDTVRQQMLDDLARELTD